MSVRKLDGRQVCNGCDKNKSPLKQITSKVYLCADCRSEKK